MIDVITNNLKAIQTASEEFDVNRLWVFGSAVRDDWDPDKSDIDFIAEFGDSERTLFRQHMGFITALEDIVGVRAQVLDARSVKREDFKPEVERTSVIIFERSRPIMTA